MKRGGLKIEKNVTEITSKYYGTHSLVFNEARNEHEPQNTTIIPKGEKIPCSVTEPFYTVSDGQTGLSCKVTESNTPETDPRFARIITSTP